MADFDAWLKGQSDKDPNVKTLKDFAAANAPTWPAGSIHLADYQAAVAASAAAGTRDRLLTVLGQYYERWFQSERQTAGNPIFDYVGLGALAFVGVLIAVILIYAIIFSKTEFLGSVGQAENARGLITFLFSIATISVILVVAIALLWMDKDEIQARFTSAKDLIAILLGVLGTIIGFYFGTATTPAIKLSVAAISFTPKEAVAGQPMTVSTKISGGASPYDYDIAVTDPSGILGPPKLDFVKGKKSSTGEIAETFNTPTVTKNGVVTVKIIAKDAKGTTAESDPALLTISKPNP